jgi:hypothetical protein
VRFLGLHLEKDLSWIVQIAMALRNGRNGLRNFRHILHKPHINMDVNLLVIKPHIVPAMRFGVEVCSHASRKKMGDSHVLVDALTESLSMARSHPVGMQGWLKAGMHACTHVMSC